MGHIIACSELGGYELLHENLRTVEFKRFKSLLRNLKIMNRITKRKLAKVIVMFIV